MSSLSSSSEPLLLEKQNHHPRDSRITFREHDHKYFVAVSISVTGLIGSLFPEFKEREVCEKMLDSRVFPTLPKHNVYRNMPIWARVENEGDTLVVNTHWCKGAYIYGREKAIDLILAYWEANRVQAASLGTAMHRDIELTLNGVEVKNETKEYGYFLEYRGMMEKAGWQPYRTEQTLFDQLLDLAGSCDMQFTRGERDEEGRLKIMVSDWKRSKKIETENKWQSGLGPVAHLQDHNKNHYFIQLNLYKYLLEKWYDVVVVGMEFVVFHPDNPTFLCFPVPDMEREVRDIVAWRADQVGPMRGVLKRSQPSEVSGAGMAGINSNSNSSTSTPAEAGGDAKRVKQK